MRLAVPETLSVASIPQAVCAQYHLNQLSKLTSLPRKKTNSRLPWHVEQVAQLSQRDRAAGWVSCGQKWKMIICRQYSSTTVT